MIIHNFHVQRILIVPAETHAPLVIDPDAVLAFPVGLQRLQMVPKRHPQIVQTSRLVQQQQFSPRHAPNLRREAADDSSLNSLSVSGQAKPRIIRPESITISVIAVNRSRPFKLSEIINPGK